MRNSNLLKKVVEGTKEKGCGLHSGIRMLSLRILIPKNLFWHKGAIVVECHQNMGKKLENVVHVNVVSVMLWFIITIKALIHTDTTSQPVFVLLETWSNQLNWGVRIHTAKSYLKEMNESCKVFLQEFFTHTLMTLSI